MPTFRSDQPNVEYYDFTLKSGLGEFLVKGETRKFTFSNKLLSDEELKELTKCQDKRIEL